MATRSVSPTRRLVTALAIAASTGLLLSSCAPSGQGATPTASETAEPTAVETAPATDEATPEETPSEDPTVAAPQSQEIGVDCAGLISNQQMYDYNPNVSLLNTVALDTSSNVSTVDELNGLVCQWVNASTEDTIDVGVALLDDATIENLKNLAIDRSSAVPTYRESGADEGYFSATGKEAQAFVGDYWITMRSEMFLEPGDPQILMADAIANLNG
ncbi:MAG: hypothetical protein ACTJHU_02790 [Mycetocola sp.]